MADVVFNWKGYDWMNGQPWGEFHPNPKYIWYSDKNEARVGPYDCLLLDINNHEKYFPGIDQTKKYGCGYISTCETFTYGNFHFEYILPIGIHLWPAIWLSGLDSWPPEIDIVEGWTGDGYFIKNQPNYKKFIGFNRIHPGVYYGKDENGNPIGKAFGSLGATDVTYSCYQNTNGKSNTCDLEWWPDYVRVYYNKHKVMEIKDKTILDGLSGRMYVCIDLAAGNNFTQDDYEKYRANGLPFIIKDFVYNHEKN